MFKEIVMEKAPPSSAIETWIKKNKKSFKDRYGEDRGLAILYAKAWDMYHQNEKKE